MVIALIPVCNKAFSSQSRMKAHQHMVTVRILVCNKALIDERSLIAH